MCFLFLSSDWAESNLEVPNVVVSKGNEIRVIVQILDGLLMCSCVLVMSGKQCGPLHLALVAHCREYLWKITPPDVTRRIVEGSGMVDYLNIMWAIDSDFQLYRNVTESVGFAIIALPTRADGIPFGTFTDEATTHPATHTSDSTRAPRSTSRPTSQAKSRRPSTSFPRSEPVCLTPKPSRIASLSSAASSARGAKARCRAARRESRPISRPAAGRGHRCSYAETQNELPPCRCAPFSAGGGPRWRTCVPWKSPVGARVALHVAMR